MNEELKVKKDNQQPKIERDGSPSPLAHNPPLIKILLVEDSHGDARLIEEMTREASHTQVELVHVNRATEALNRLRKERFDIILLDLLLPDGTGLNTFFNMHNRAQNVPIIVLTGIDSETLAIKAVRGGAQDYLVKGQMDGRSLLRSIRHAVERHQIQSKLRNVSLRDELTDLYNRRGFLDMAEQNLKLSQRTNRGFLLFFADLDGLKQINDNFGHHEGDVVIAEAAYVLRKTLRRSNRHGVWNQPGGRPNDL